MGSAKSKSVINSVIKQSLSSSVRVVQNCKTSVHAGQSLIIGEDTADLDIDLSGWEQTVTVDLKCMQSAKVKNEIANNISNALQQALEASSDQLIPLGKAKTDATVNLTKDIAVKLSEEFVQNCVNKIVGDQSVIVKRGARHHRIRAKNWKITVEGSFSCAQNSEGVQKLVQKVADTVSQVGSAKTKSPYEDAVQDLIQKGLLPAVLGGGSGTAPGGVFGGGGGGGMGIGFYVFIFILLVAIGGGAYYFLVVKK